MSDVEKSGIYAVESLPGKVVFIGISRAVRERVRKYQQIIRDGKPDGVLRSLPLAARLTAKVLEHCPETEIHAKAGAWYDWYRGDGWMVIAGLEVQTNATLRGDVITAKAGPGHQAIGIGCDLPEHTVMNVLPVAIGKMAKITEKFSLSDRDMTRVLEQVEETLDRQKGGY
jgi:hypothetical protein